MMEFPISLASSWIISVNSQGTLHSVAFFVSKIIEIYSMSDLVESLAGFAMDFTHRSTPHSTRQSTVSNLKLSARFPSLPLMMKCKFATFLTFSLWFLPFRRRRFRSHKHENFITRFVISHLNMKVNSRRSSPSTFSSVFLASKWNLR